MSAVVSLIVVQSIVSRLSTSAGVDDAMRQQQVKFSSVKAANGSALCAAAQPSTVAVSVRSKTDCVRVCQSHRPSCRHVNYRPNTKLCQLFFDSPTDYLVLPDCLHLQVGL
jgi:hypothetical protein